MTFSARGTRPNVDMIRGTSPVAGSSATPQLWSTKKWAHVSDFGGPVARERTQHGRLRRVGCVLTIIIVLSACSSTPDTTADGIVQRVVDSETLQVTIDGQIQDIRLQNIATPAGEDEGGTPNCLEPETNSFVRKMLPPTTPVRIEFESASEDIQGQAVANVYVNDRSVNEAVVGAGLGLVDSSDGEHELVTQLMVAQERARADQVGLFSAEVDCTIPGQVQIAAGVDCTDLSLLAGGGPPASAGSSSSTSPSTAATSSTSPTSSAAAEPAAVIAVDAGSNDLIRRADSAAATLAKAVELRESITQDEGLLIWRALNPLQRNACATAIVGLVDNATRDHTALVAAVVVAQQREVEEARIAEEQRQAEAARVAEERRLAAEQEAARVAEVQRVAAEADAARLAEEQRVAAEAEANRIAAEQQRAVQAAEAAEASRAAEQQRQQDAALPARLE